MYWESLTNGNEGNRPSTDGGANWAALPFQDITTNTTNIATNTANIATNASNIAANTAAINLIPGKNAIINGNFDIWKRGDSISVTTTSLYTADRWIVDARLTAVGAATVTQEDFTPGQTDVPFEPRYFLRLDQTTASDGSVDNLRQRIESARSFAGQDIAISFYAKVDSAKTFDVNIKQSFGSGGSPSSDVTTSGSAINVTTSWQKFELTVAVPSISGVTFGTDNNDYLEVSLSEDTQTIFTLDVAQFQVEKGTTSSEFERRLIGEEVRLCERYFQKSYDLDTNLGATTTSGVIRYTATGTNTSQRTVNFSRLRGTPAVTLYSSATGASGNIRDNTGGTDQAASAVSIGEAAFAVQKGSVHVDQSEYLFHYALDSEL